MGELESRKRAKLRKGDKVEVFNEIIELYRIKIK